jgi:hypothetical protein
MVRTPWVHHWCSNVTPLPRIASNTDATTDRLPELRVFRHYRAPLSTRP